MAEGAELVIAVGGDGTVNEVARGLLGSGAALGIVPIGSGNGLARALRLPLRPTPALAALEAGVRRPIDVGRLNGGLFLNVAGTGFDAAVGAAFQRAGRDGRRRGLLSYLRLSLAEAVHYRPRPLVIEAEGERRELTPYVVTFANGPQYGSGAVINPGGLLDDGRLEAVFFAWRGSVAGILAAAPRLFLGGLEKLPSYGRVSGTRMTVIGSRPWPSTATATPSSRPPESRWSSCPGRSRSSSPPPPSRTRRDPSRGTPDERAQPTAASACSRSRRISSRAAGGAGRSGARTSPPRRPARSMASLSPATPQVVVTAEARGVSAC